MSSSGLGTREPSGFAEEFGGEREDRLARLVGFVAHGLAQQQEYRSADAACTVIAEARGTEERGAGGAAQGMLGRERRRLRRWSGRCSGTATGNRARTCSGSR